uniref:Odorant binding protein 22 n=1 Tax=Colaphellus bowringi TaxID=561076 RepID=A0A0S3J419_9CUCU|nr:odorant binding protein 22 [Colaphellus bowringi]
MRVFIVFCCVIGHVLTQMVSPSQLNTILQYHTECREKTKLPNSLVTGLIAGQFPNDPVLKSHLLCVHQKLGVQDADGNLRKEFISETLGAVLPASVDSKELLNKCAVQKSSPEDTALDLDRCLYQTVQPMRG